MAWKTMNVDEQRVRFVVAASRQERTHRALCEEFGISRPTGYLWLARYKAQGLTGLKEKSRRPEHSPRRSAPDVEARVVGLRRRYPEWGARKLQVLLAREGVELTLSTIHRILLRHDLVADADRHQAATKRFQRAAPNELWQMDFKSPLGYGTHVGPLSVLDDHSRYLITLSETGTTRSELVRERLEEAFQRCGVPEAMLMDHGTPWWNVRSVGGITGLGVWLMRQGIQLHWSGFRHPQTQGKVERFHGSLEKAQSKRGLPQGNRQQWLEAYRREYNEVRPHEALAMRTPAELWRKSPRKYDPNPPGWDYEAGSEVRQVGKYGHLYVNGQRWDLSLALAGEWVKLVRIEERILVYYGRTVISEWQPGTHRSTAMERWIPTY
jgi:transposase InsO family protein